MKDDDLEMEVVVEEGGLFKKVLEVVLVSR